MSKIIIKYKKTIMIAFLLITALCIFTTQYSKVNYNMADYLPEKASSTIAMELLEKEFHDEMPNARVMVNNVTIEQALEYKMKIANIEGVSNIQWLDDVVDLTKLANSDIKSDPSLLETYYKDGSALFNITIEKGCDEKVADAINTIIGNNNSSAGTAINMATTQRMSQSEVLNAFFILIPLILIILVLTTSSWLEPLLFLATIGIAVILNMGTNFIMGGDISFVTQSIAPILQFAVSLDYAIFLLHSFSTERKKTTDINIAMKQAMKNSFPIVLASAITTIVGFLALLFMRFEIGANLGIILVKGIVLSFICVMVLLPTITLCSCKLIDKMKHKSFIPDFKKTGNILLKIRIPFLIIALLLALPCFIAQTKTNFTYGTTSIAESSKAGVDALKIEEKFGKENILVILVPKGELQKELNISMELMKTKHITKVLSFPIMASIQMPIENQMEVLNKQFYSENYGRLIIYTDVKEEGTETFNLIKDIKNIVNKEYSKSYITGESMVLYDMKNIVAKDINIVNLIAIIGILIVLLINFKSLFIPIILVFVIETAIWINLAITYFMGNSLSFVGYLIISTVQLGATVDYAILFTEKYLQNRNSQSKLEAIKTTINSNLVPISISAFLLSLAGFCLNFTSSNPVVKELGILLGRGTLLSFAMVIFVLPALLIIFDKWIKKSKLQITNIKKDPVIKNAKTKSTSDKKKSQPKESNK
ncbi:MAG: MMPL family transporter [Bacilli bacterium]